MMTKKIQTTLLGGLLSASIVSSAIAGDFATPVKMDVAPESDIFEFSAGYHTTYVWRGIDFGDEMADWSLEASKEVGDFDLTAGIWAANVFSVDGGSEVDLYANASKDLGFATLELGYIFYYFDGDTSLNTQEVYLGLSKEIGRATLSAKYFYDVDLTEVSYLELAVEQSFKLGRLGDLNASISLGINPEDSEFTHIQPTISKSFDLNSEVTLTPYISYSFALEDTDANGTVRDDEFIAGVSIGFSF